MSSVPLRRTVYTGTLIDTPILGELRVRQHAIVGVDERGCIAFLDDMGDEPGDEEEEKVRRVVGGWGWESNTGTAENEDVQQEWDWVRGEEGAWWFPGFVGELKLLVFLCGGTGGCFFFGQFHFYRRVFKERVEKWKELGSGELKWTSKAGLTRKTWLKEINWKSSYLLLQLPRWGFLS